MQNHSIIIMQTTFADEHTTKKILEILLNKKLIACAHLSAVRSNYIWKGDLECHEEQLCFLKTIPSLINQVKEEITKGHTYELPEILYWQAATSLEYSQWVHSCCLDEKQE